MKKYSQFQKIISLVMIFIMLIYVSGCVSSKILSKSELPVSGYSEYKIQCQNTNFLISDVKILNGELSGKVESAASTRYANIVNIYLTSDSVVKIDSGKILTVPCDSITKVKVVKASVVKSYFLVSGIIVVLVLIILHSSFLDFNVFPNGI
jgi:hypothetical protein